MYHPICVTLSTAAARLLPAGRRLLLGLLAFAPLVAVDRSRLGGGQKDDFLTGDWGGVRSAWSARGVDLGFAYTAATYANVSGGLATGHTEEGTADLSVDLDLQKARQWSGARLHVSATAAHGSSASTHLVGDVNKVSSYYLDPGVYLHEVWWEQSWLDARLSVRSGKLSMDLEFPVYGYADAIPLPLYPTGALGTRLRWAPTPHWQVQAAVFDGDPTDGRTGVQRGTRVRLGRGDGYTAIVEAAANLGAGPGASVPAGTWKLGAYHSSRRSFDPATGARRSGNYAFYLNGDQTLWRVNPQSPTDERGLALYVVGEYAPPDRNTYRYGFGGGPYFTGPFRGRAADVIYLNFLYTRFGGPYSAAAVAGGEPAYTFENRWQLNYQFAVTKFFSLTPELDYIERPGGHGALPDAFVFSLRTNVTF